MSRQSLFCAIYIYIHIIRAPSAHFDAAARLAITRLDTGRASRLAIIEILRAGRYAQPRLIDGDKPDDTMTWRDDIDAPMQPACHGARASARQYWPPPRCLRRALRWGEDMRASLERSLISARAKRLPRPPTPLSSPASRPCCDKLANFPRAA